MVGEGRGSSHIIPVYCLHTYTHLHIHMHTHAHILMYTVYKWYFLPLLYFWWPHQNNFCLAFYVLNILTDWFLNWITCLLLLGDWIDFYMASVFTSFDPNELLFLSPCKKTAIHVLSMQFEGWKVTEPQNTVLTTNPVQFCSAVIKIAFQRYSEPSTKALVKWTCILYLSRSITAGKQKLYKALNFITYSPGR